MKNSDKTVAIVVPVYKTELDEHEIISLEKCFEFWGNKFDIYFVKPGNLDISAIREKFSSSFTTDFDDHFFRNLKGYNALMFSTEFYQRFLDYKYIFIYQTDGYAFRDELEQWCGKDYDYIGAPWIPRKKSANTLNKLFVSLRRRLNSLRGIPDRSTQYFEVGNGGVSLRKTKTFHDITIADRSNIEHYLANLGKSPLYNEDIYWSLGKKIIPGRQNETGQLLKPDYKEALGFAFDMNPEVCYELTDHHLPFCCHSFSKPKFWKFWKKHIPA